MLRRHRLALLSSLPLLAAAPWSSPAYAVCTSAGSSATVCVVTDRNEGPGTAANPTLRYAIEEANNTGGTTAVRVDPGPVAATISGASFVLGDGTNSVQFEGSGGIKIDAPMVLNTPLTFTSAQPFVSFGSSIVTGARLTFNTGFDVQTSLSVAVATISGGAILKCQ